MWFLLFCDLCQSSLRMYSLILLVPDYQSFLRFVKLVISLDHHLRTSLVLRPVVLSTGSNALLRYTDWAVACSVKHWAWSPLPVTSLSRCSPTTGVKFFYSTVAKAAGRAHKKREWVRRQLDPPVAISLILSHNVQLTTNDGAFASRVSSATCTTWVRSLQPQINRLHPAQHLSAGSKKNRQRQRQTAIKKDRRQQQLFAASRMHTSFANRVQTGGSKGSSSTHPEGTIAVLDQTSAIFFIAQSRG